MAKLAKTFYVVFLLLLFSDFIFAADAPIPVEFKSQTQATFSTKAPYAITDAFHSEGTDRTIGIDTMETISSFLWVFKKNSFISRL
jgi:hypothetical protein